MAHKPTPEQEAILEAATSSDDNLLIRALAGTAKTTSLELISVALPEVNILCLAFNKKIAVEMDERLPSNCRALTLNSLGHRTWSDAIGRRLRIDGSKGYNIMKELIEDLPRTERQEAYKSMAELMRVVSFGKACGYVPTDTHSQAKRLMNDEDFFEHIEQKLHDFERDLVRGATLVSLAAALQGHCDYDDQILMPTLFHGVFPRYPLVLVDEAQDLSALNHAMLRKLVRNRLIAVGDSCQAIYGFRGAHADSLNELQQHFQMREMTLSISFRCPQAVVEHVQWRAPNMRAPEWAAQGKVSTLTKWSVDDLPEAAAILCRNNAPLFALAIKLLKNGRHAELGGSDIIKFILSHMRKFGSSDLPQVDVLDCIDHWEVEQKNKTKGRAHGRIEDHAECMRIFANQADDLGGAIAYAHHMTQFHSPLKLMTGHKAKGLEFNDVFFLNQKLVSKKEQDPNLRYVISTRARETLTYVELEHFVDKETIEV